MAAPDLYTGEPLGVPQSPVADVGGAGTVISQLRRLTTQMGPLQAISGSVSLNPIASHSGSVVISSAFTVPIPAGATKVVMQAISQNVRYTLDGTAPTTTLGFQMFASDPPVTIPIGSSTVLKVIQEAATASLQYQFFV